jgi:hypothetical protein
MTSALTVRNNEDYSEKNMQTVRGYRRDQTGRVWAVEIQAVDKADGNVSMTRHSQFIRMTFSRPTMKPELEVIPCASEIPLLTNVRSNAVFYYTKSIVRETTIENVSRVTSETSIRFFDGSLWGKRSSTTQKTTNAITTN